MRRVDGEQMASGRVDGERSGRRRQPAVSMRDQDPGSTWPRRRRLSPSGGNRQTTCPQRAPVPQSLAISTGSCSPSSPDPYKNVGSARTWQMSAGLGHCPAKWPTTAEAASGWGLAVRGTLISLEHPGGLADKGADLRPPAAGKAARTCRSCRPDWPTRCGTYTDRRRWRARPPTWRAASSARRSHHTRRALARYQCGVRQLPVSPLPTSPLFATRYRTPLGRADGPSSPSVAASTRLPARQAMVLSYDATYDEAAEVSYDRSPDPYTNRLADGTYVVRGGRAANLPHVRIRPGQSPHD